jgi:hypothetical protein
MTINPIANGESGLSARNKINSGFTKLNGVADGATANATDAQLRDRSTHTGTQAVSTISDFDAAVATQNANAVALTGGTVTGMDRLGLSTTGGLTPTQGQFVWDADNQTALLGLNGSTLDLGQEMHYHVRNATGVSIPKGTAVRATGTIGMSGRITVAPMIADGTIPAKFFLGITREAIADGADGKVTAFGKVRGINTNAFNEGDVLWVSATSAGALTNVEPVAPALKLPIAFVVTKSTTVGAVQVRVTVSATVEQGAKADSAVQPGDLATVATTGAYSDLSGTPTLGTAAAADTGDFATSAQGGLADTAVQPGDLAAVATTGDYDDLTNAPDLTKFIESDPTGVTGADAIVNIISLTQAEYDAIVSPDAATLYVITA